ncbi:membrane protein [Isoptericola hypogeus]|uniref:Membrane protein n=1 Tax=Isoptericola hypogeus TaxID=300179 RepID=A0ABN2JRS3_9MICO
MNLSLAWSELALVVLVVAAVVVWLAWLSASRLDRLHRKVVASRIALQAQLARRAGTALDLAASGLLDPAGAVLVADTAFAVVEDEAPPAPGAELALEGLGATRERAESELSAVLRSALGDDDFVHSLRGTADGDELVGALAAAWYRAQLARRFHNEAVAQAQRARRTWYVRLLHLTGRAGVPHTVELDDQMPEGLGQS